MLVMMMNENVNENVFINPSNAGMYLLRVRVLFFFHLEMIWRI